MEILLQELLACRNARYRNQMANDFVTSIESVKDLGVLYFWLKRIAGSVKSTKRRIKFVRKMMAKIYERCMCNACSASALTSFSRKAGIVPVYAYLM